MPTENTYVASDGSRWTLTCDYPPIPTRAYDWCAVHENFGGPGDDRHVYGSTIEEAIEAVENWIAENRPDPA